MNHLRILLPALDRQGGGVADYGFHLAEAIRRKGVRVTRVGLHDRAIEQPGRDGDDLRLPAGMSWGERGRLFTDYWAEDPPDAVSLQFVPYGFQNKGLPFALASLLGSVDLPTVRHVMFHEIWIGAARPSPWKDRGIGFLQRLAIARLLNRFRPTCVHSHAEPYRRLLEPLAGTVQSLPLFSNIPVAPPDGLTCPAKDQVPDTVGIFSRLPPECDLLPFLHSYQRALTAVDRTGRIRWLGFANPEAFPLETWQQAAPRVSWDIVGPRTEAELPDDLAGCQLAIAGVPLALWEKSGVVAAWRAAGVPVLFIREPIRFPGTEPAQPLPAGLIPQIDGWLEAWRSTPRADPPPDPDTVAERMLSDLNEAHSPGEPFS
ncbi:MAG: hypothetical protein ACFE0O_02545 [Opitutales bacterium]